MEQKTLARWLKFVIIGVAVCGLVADLLIIPSLGESFVGGDKTLEPLYWPWLIFAWVASLPCYAALILAWLVARNIGKDNSFSMANAKLLKAISIVAAADVAFIFVTEVVFLLLNMNHPGVLLFSLVVLFIGIAISVACAVLSHLIVKAAGLQEQSDLTI